MPTGIRKTGISTNTIRSPIGWLLRHFLNPTTGLNTQICIATSYMYTCITWISEGEPISFAFVCSFISTVKIHFRIAEFCFLLGSFHRYKLISQQNLNWLRWLWNSQGKSAKRGDIKGFTYLAKVSLQEAPPSQVKSCPSDLHVCSFISTVKIHSQHCRIVFPHQALLSKTSRF